MSPTERSVQRPSPETGVFARLCGLRRTRRIGAPLLAALVVVGMLLSASGALAAGGPPIFNHNELQQLLFSTRVTIGARVENGGKYEVEYGTSETGPWTEVPFGEFHGDGDTVMIGAQDPVFFGVPTGSAFWLRGLAPDTQYYARFLATNAEGKAEEVVPFKTLPVAKPEIDRVSYRDFTNDGTPSFKHSPGGVTDTSAGFEATIEGNGAETKYTFEYAPAEAGGVRPAEASVAWKPFTSGPTGTVSVAEEHALIKAGLAGLTPETKYYVRITMSNSQGKSVQATYTPPSTDTEEVIRGETESFTTGTSRPVAPVIERGVRNRTIDSAHVTDSVAPHGSETRWRFEYATSVLGLWTVAPGGEGTISQAQAEAKPYGVFFPVGATLTGLKPAEKYYVRLFTENAAGEGKTCPSYVTNETGSGEVGCELVSEQTLGFDEFETLGFPSVSTFAVHGLVGGSLQLDGGVNSRSTPTSAEQTITLEGAPTGGTFTLTFDGHTTGPIAYDAPARQEGEVPNGDVREALEAALGSAFVEVEGPAGGPYTVFFEAADAGVGEPQIEADGSGLTPSGKVSVHTDYKGGETTETHYRFQYVSQASFAERGWSGAQETPEATAPAGGELEVVNALLPALTAGETYRYRILGSSSISGAAVFEGNEQSLTVPKLVAGAGASADGCPNGALRTGLSARLPDCRAYEQLSPVEKYGSQEPFQYGTELNLGWRFSEDGENALLEATPVNWVPGASGGGSPYLFSRAAGKGWGLTAGSPQPETGLENVTPQLYNAAVTQVAFEAKYSSSKLSESANVAYKVGPVGGPYTTVASIPRGVASTEEGWVAANGGFSKLVFETQDRELLGESTGTRSGPDLYEYTAQGGLRQVNVSGEPAITIGTCGATIVRGVDEEGMNNPAHQGIVGGPHSVSADGSRVFFYAGFGHECPSEAELTGENHPKSHLYMRVNGAETVDIGAYTFRGANAEGTRLLLVKDGTSELLAYDTETGVITPQSSGELAEAQELTLLGIGGCFNSCGAPGRVEAGEGAEPFAHPRYTYWGARPSNLSNNLAEDQAYRYDSVEHLVQCISCASSSDPNPKQPAFMTSNIGVALHGGVQDSATASANGRFAFFTTPAALVPQDVDGEIGIESAPPTNGVSRGTGGLETGEYLDETGTTGPSSDVYEWRAAGVDGCVQLQGCLALITDGRGGYQNILLGTAHEGRDVFIYTRSTLVAQTGRPEGSLGEGNIYDARIEGGFAPLPPRPTECEGDACSNPPGAPTDVTPSSLTFSGQGNMTPGAASAPAEKKVVVKKKHKVKKKARSKNKRGKTAKRAGRAARDRRSRS